MKKFILITLSILTVSFINAQKTVSGTILYKLNEDDNLAIVTFPGNIGTEDTLLQVWNILEKNNF